MLLPLKRINDEVFVATDEIVRFDVRSVEFVKERAAKNPRGRARICAHKSSEDSLHEMLIAIRSDSYIRPHRHKNKVESFHLIEGEADIVILSEAGDVEEAIRLGPKDNFYYRLDTARYHTLLINSPLLVIHEITNGPFDINAGDFGAFAPHEGDAGASAYIAQLRSELGSRIKN